jgi:hypothetical protein
MKFEKHWVYKMKKSGTYWVYKIKKLKEYCLFILKIIVSLLH